MRNALELVETVLCCKVFYNSVLFFLLIMPALPLCEQCGGKEFYIESGFYVCTECHVLSQDVREERFGEEVDGHVRSQVIKPSKTAQNSLGKHPARGKEVTSWEVLNFVLKGLLDELVSLGCDPKLKIIALQLWCTYLKKLEVAFTSVRVRAKPRLGLTFRKKDAELVYGVSSQAAASCQSLFCCSTSGSRTSSQSSRKKRYADIARSIYEESFGNKTGCDGASSTASIKMKYTSPTKKILLSLHDNDELSRKVKLEKGKLAFERERASMRHATINRVVAIINLALFITGSKVVISDLIRWAREGYLSLGRAENLLPPGVHVTGDLKSLFITNHYSWKIMMMQVSQLAHYLVIKPPQVDLVPICEKFVDKLHLPADILVTMKLFLKEFPPQVGLQRTSNFEGRALGFILFVMKLAFSLDDSTEIILSEAAKRINSYNENQEHLFVWSDWVKSIICSQAVVSLHHAVTREQLYPGSTVGSATPFIGQWMNAPKKQTFERVKVVPGRLSLCIERLMTPLSQPGLIPLLPNVPYSDQLIDSQPAEVKAFFPPPSHSRGVLAPFLDKYRMKALAENCGLRFVKGIVKGFEKLAKFKLKRDCPQSKKHCRPVRMELDSASESESDPCQNSKLDNLFKGSSDSERAPNGIKNLAVRVNLEPAEFVEEEPIVYFPSYEYWMIHGSFHHSGMNIGEFDEYARKHFPSSFYFLLHQCTLVGQQCSRDIYNQLILIESMYHQRKRKKYKKLRCLLKNW